MRSWTAKSLLLAGICAVSSPIQAQGTAKTVGEGRPIPTLQDTIGTDDFTIEASIRARYESYENPFRPGNAQAADLFNLRTLVIAQYDTGPIAIGATLQDSRAYLADPGTPLGTSEINALELLEAYVKADLGEIGGGGTSTELTAGRFVINLGSKRLVGNPGFRNTGNGFTGAKIDWSDTTRKRSFTAFYTLPQQRLPSGRDDLLDNAIEWDRESDDLVFWGGFFSMQALTPHTHLELYLYGLDDDDRIDRPTRNRNLITPGARIYSDRGASLFDYEVEAAYQTGTVRTSSRATAPQVDVAAYTIAAEFGYTFDTAYKLRVALVGNLASGDHGNSTEENRFDTLFGIRRGEWGPSSSLYGPLSRNNIRDLGLRVEMKPSSRVDEVVSAHTFWLDSKTDSFAKTGIVDPAGVSGRFAGSQVEGRLRYWLVPKFLQTEIGGAVLFKGDFLEDAPNAPTSGNTRYGYIDLTLSF